ncbi:hypothetical protein [Crocinitomix catalasitica]|uniref:hypothetical protein n=1 Tax=Crocinitomix catalasitica TaxID=184607 RepID=UPI000487150D|nr:hypothetical protein [Crocinitomix catalasitica]
MRKILLVVLVFISVQAFTQIYNRESRVNIGMSSIALEFKNKFNSINDTSLTQFEFVTKSPIISFTQSYVLGRVISISGRIGFQYLNLFYNNTHYGSPIVFASVSPELTLYNGEKFDYYLKLQIGLTYWFNNPEILDSDIRRLFSEKATLFTGFTLVGINYMISPKYGLNTELTLWSPELISVGIVRRFLRGSIPSDMDMRNL